MNTQAIDTAKSLLRIQKYLERLELAKGYHKEYIHTFINKNNTKVPLLTADLKALLQQVAITPAHEDAREHACIAELEAQLSAIGAGGVEPLRKQAAPQGWKLVPVEPTERMVSEGSCAQALKHGHRYIGECAAKTAWSFMLAAAPKPPEAAPVPQWDGKINPADFNVETFRCSGKNGWIAKPDNYCVRITHVHTGLFEEGVSERSIHTNKAEAWERLSARLEAIAKATGGST